MNKLTPSQYQRAKRLFWEVKEIAKEEREKYLTEVCADDLVVINEVLTLLNTENETGILDRGNAIEQVISEANLKVIGKNSVMEENKINPKDLIGKKFNDRYEIMRLLGEGGMGTVYLAKDSKIGKGKEVAIKVLLKPIEDESAKDQIKRFLREANKLAKINHPNVVKIADVDKTNFAEANNFHFFVMEYLHGAKLVELMNRGNNFLSQARKLNVISQICDGLKAAHEQDILHRDLTPNNIMIFSNENKDHVTIFDFGIAKSVSDEETVMTEAGTFIGTLPYMSPEQFREEKIDFYSDIYSLGIIIYKMLSDQHPLLDKNQNNVPGHLWMNKHVHRQPIEILTICPDLPESLAIVIMKMLDKQPTNRPELGVINSEINKLIGSSLIYGNSIINDGLGNKGNSKKSITEITTVKMLATEKYKFITAKLDKKGKIIQKIDKERLQFIEDVGNGIKLELVEIPTGSFMMGTKSKDIEKVVSEYKRYGRSEEDARRWLGWETPQHKVEVPTFYMGKYQVTQEQWEAIMGSNPSGFKGDDKLPVEQVSWDEAMEFCKRLSEKTNKVYRLPSEAEWEYACRAGTETPFGFGETINTDIVNYDGNYPYGEGAKGEYRAKTTVVGSLGVANDFGLYDMHGNVWEWCEDEWHDSYKGAPIDGSAWEKQEADNSSRVVRGGSWINNAYNCRSANRYMNAPGNQNISLGLRVVLVARTLK